MKLTEEELKELHQQGTARSARERAGCPSEATFARATTGELSRLERERFTDHLTACSDCAGEYRLIQSLKSEVEPLTTHRKGRVAAFVLLWEKLVWAPAWRAAAAVTTIAIIIGSVTLWRVAQTSLEPGPADRGSDALTMRIEPLNRAVLDQPPQRLVWSESKPAESYRVVLYDFESTPIWESPPVKETAVLLPEEIRNRLQRGRAVFWRVISQDGIARRQSEVFQFTISP